MQAGGIFRGALARQPQGIRNFYKMKQDAFSHPLIDIVVPDLGTGSEPVRLLNWLVPVNAQIIPGERLVELLTHGTLLYLESLCAGTLVEQRALPGTPVQVGDVLGTIQELRQE